MTKLSDFGGETSLGCVVYGIGAGSLLPVSSPCLTHRGGGGAVEPRTMGGVYMPIQPTLFNESTMQRGGFKGVVCAYWS